MQSIMKETVTMDAVHLSVRMEHFHANVDKF